MELLGRFLKKLKDNNHIIKKFELDCASKTHGRRSISGGISDEGIQMLSVGLDCFKNDIINLKLDFSL